MTTYKLIYDMGELGQKVFEIRSETPDKDAYAFMAKNPADPTVQNIYLHKGYIVNAFTNKSFSWDAYNKAVDEKRWREEYFKRTGKRWSGENQHEDPTKQPPDIDDEEETELDFDACLRLFELDRGFTEKELKDAYRKAVKMNHPDKVASLSAEFKKLAERRTKQINQAYSKLLQGIRK